MEINKIAIANINCGNSNRCRRVRAVSENLMAANINDYNVYKNHQKSLYGTCNNSTENIRSENFLDVLGCATEPCCSLNVSPSTSPPKFLPRYLNYLKKIIHFAHITKIPISSHYCCA